MPPDGGGLRDGLGSGMSPSCTLSVMTAEQQDDASGATGSGLARPGATAIGPRIEAWSAAAVPVDLEPLGDADGEQRAGATDLGPFGDGTFGVWTITEGVSDDVEADEVSVILSGRGRVEDLDSGIVLELTPGTVLRLSAGARTRWTIAEPVRKVYIVR